MRSVWLVVDNDAMEPSRSGWTRFCAPLTRVFETGWARDLLLSIQNRAAPESRSQPQTSLPPSLCPNRLSAVPGRAVRGRYDRVLAIVNFDREGRETAARAARLAIAHGADLALLHATDWPGGSDWPDFCLLPPHEVEDRVRCGIERRLRAIAGNVIASELAALVELSRDAELLLARLRSWEPDLILATQSDIRRLRLGAHLIIRGRRCDVVSTE